MARMRYGKRFGNSSFGQNSTYGYDGHIHRGMMPPPWYLRRTRDPLREAMGQAKRDAQTHDRTRKRRAANMSKRQKEIDVDIVCVEQINHCIGMLETVLHQQGDVNRQKRIGSSPVSQLMIVQAIEKLKKSYNRGAYNDLIQLETEGEPGGSKLDPL